MSSFLEILNQTASLISLIAVAMLTSYFSWREKRDKKIQTLKKEKGEIEIEIEQKRHLDEMNGINDKITNIKNNQDSLIKSIEKIKESLDTVMDITAEDNKTIKNIIEKMEYNHRNIKELNKQIHELEATIEHQGDTMQYISSNLYNRIIYSKSLANVVTTLAEALKDNHIDSNIHDSLADFKKIEDELFFSMSELSLDIKK